MVKKEKKKKKTACYFCQRGEGPDYKKPEDLAKFLSPRARILPRSKTGVCAKHQRRLSQAIKRARHLSLLPFVAGKR